MRKILSFHISDPVEFKEQVLLWSKQFNRLAILDSHEVNQKANSKKEYNSYELIAGIDALNEIQLEENCFDTLKQTYDANQDWWFGFMTYDLKNELEDLSSENFDGVKMPALHFFQPRWVLALKEDLLVIHYFESENSEEDIKELVNQVLLTEVDQIKASLVPSIQHRISKEEYLEAVNALKNHIRLGDIYEVNFCQEFYAESTKIDPLETYRSLRKVSPTPYSCYYALGNKFLLSASPERYIKKQGLKIISQPIKGTAKRGKTPEEDYQIKEFLYSDPKERAENIMIVDLVRNDLSRTAAKGSVKVEELCGIYSFPQVHQMISTVVSELREDIHFVDCIKHSFPMGSMTGAPKVRAMKLIEKYEMTKRGLFSAAVGYITPEADFDFNVVIRSIQYNAIDDYLSFMVGGAITMQSDPEKEYEECLLKAKAIKQVLGNN
ncbi:anthranilate synthase component I family protein [Ancylomarina euxinus]|uniref:Anthranilate synthase component I family protein n=1 Tax=Ancylomarina euxinus TaxID=2283627 RepID=A0A425Y0R9_9BACT|nr:anthranilate synthase component I family protein [Ancylomarina euxinus]MCZ4695263.1 anthranilate synthase component I family protein [Ancylomarina euxinus]MUP15460.1 aminodeoxychorismate synthase component I [Ancylomarina euxinus]RRG21170.1 anthranilate synthase component I family protein [Ancylomarina euxinus]